MPISSFLGIQTALRGMIAEQEALDTTSHNVANSSTPGYSRQQVDLNASHALTIPVNSQEGVGAQIGTGVDVAAISRIRNQFLDVQYRGQNTTLGETTQEAATLGNAETAFDEPSDSGIASQLSSFWDDWSSLANATDSTRTAAQQALVDDAGTLTDTFNTLANELRTDQSDAQSQYDSLTGANGTVETDARQLAALNDAISHAVGVGQSPNDLMDQRDQLIDQLSSLANVSVTDMGNGAERVDFGGVTLVDPSVANGYTWPQTLTSPGGQLGALQDLASPTGKIAGYLTQLDGVANRLVSAVNSLQPGRPFFDPTGTTASTIRVVAAPADVQTGASGDSGDVGLANQIAQLRGGTVDQAYNALVAQVGSDVQGANASQTNAQALVDATQDSRDSVSGVSIDEEVTNLMTFQRGYQACARALTTMDQDLDTLINRTGTVGL